MDPDRRVTIAFRVGGGPADYSCYLHGADCHVPWGSDEQHSVEGFALWRAIRRDDCLTRAELNAKLLALAARLGVDPANAGLPLNGLEAL